MPSASPAPSLSIAVLGVGKIGSAFAYQLARAGHRVTGVARPDSLRLRQLRRDNAIVLNDGSRTQIAVSDRLESRHDLVLVTTTADQARSLLPALRDSRAKTVHCMFVCFDAASLRDELGEMDCSFGMPAINASLDREGQLTIKIGRAKTLHGDQRWVELFNRAGIPSALEARMELWLRCHTPMTAAMASTAIAKRHGDGTAFNEQSRLAACGMRAGFQIIETLGDRPYPRSKAVMSHLPRPVLATILRQSARFFPDDMTSHESDALIDAMTSAAAHDPSLSEPIQVLRAMRP